MIRTIASRAAVMALAALACTAALAQGASGPSRSEREALQSEADRVKVVGPADVPLLGQARLALPAGRMWIPQPAAAKIMAAMGNRPDKRLIGLVYPLAENDEG